MKFTLMQQTTHCTICYELRTMPCAFLHHYPRPHHCHTIAPYPNHCVSFIPIYYCIMHNSPRTISIRPFLIHCCIITPYPYTVDRHHPQHVIISYTINYAPLHHVPYIVIPLHHTTYIGTLSSSP